MTAKRSPLLEAARRAGLDARRVSAWQRALDLLTALSPMLEPLDSRGASLIGSELWRHGTELLGEVTLASQTPSPALRLHHTHLAALSLNRFYTRLMLGRQLALLDVEPDYLEQLEALRVDLERIAHGLRCALEA